MASRFWLPPPGSWELLIRSSGQFRTTISLRRLCIDKLARTSFQNPWHHPSYPDEPSRSIVLQHTPIPWSRGGKYMARSAVRRRTSCAFASFRCTGTCHAAIILISLPLLWPTRHAVQSRGPDGFPGSLHSMHLGAVLPRCCVFQDLGSPQGWFKDSKPCTNFASDKSNTHRGEEMICHSMSRL